MEIEIRAGLGLIWALFGGLMIFGCAYNALVARMEARGWLEGYTALMVVGGVLVTMGVLAILSWQIALIGLAAFAASGTPMIIGSIARHVQRREAAMRAMREEINADNPQGVAE